MGSRERDHDGMLLSRTARSERGGPIDQDVHGQRPNSAAKRGQQCSNAFGDTNTIGSMLRPRRPEISNLSRKARLVIADAARFPEVTDARVGAGDEGTK